MKGKERNQGINANILSVPAKELPPLRGLGSTYFYKMIEFKDEISQIDAVTGETQTYSLVLQKSIRAAIVMRSLGLKPKDVITICSYNHMDCMIPYYASLFLGAISANVEPTVPLNDCIHLLKQVRPKLIFTVPESIKLMEDTIREANLDAKIIVFGDDANYMKYSEFLISSPEEQDFVPYEVTDLKETATIIFSSGSTGMPKGICLTHYGLLGYTHHLDIENIPCGTRVLLYSNLYWISTPSFTVYIILHGLNRVICRKFDVESFWDMVKQIKIYMVFLNTYQLFGILANGRPEQADTSSLELALIIGGPINNETVMDARKCFPGTVVVNVYGLTEQNGSALGLNFDSASTDKMSMGHKPNSVGKPKAGYSYKVVDPETEEILGPNQSGELRIKTEFAMNGYYNMDSSYVWDSEGYMKTGDIAYYDDEQSFFIVDRIKDLMKYKMWHISPASIEAVCYTHPAVQTCIVTGKTDMVDGDHLVGVVVLKESAVGTVSEEELQKYVDERVGHHQKLRAGLKFVKSIPLTVTGKPNRRKLKQMVEEGSI